MRTRKVYWCMPVSHHRQTSKIKSASDFQTHLTNRWRRVKRSRLRPCKVAGPGTTGVLQHSRSQCEAIQTEGRCRLRLPMEASKSKTIAILAEKPSVAQDIARVLGADVRGKGYLQGNGYVVTWAIGHLVSLAQPHEIKPEWRQWRLRSAADPAHALATGCLRENQRPIRSGAKDPDLRRGCRGSSVRQTPGARVN